VSGVGYLALGPDAPPLWRVVAGSFPQKWDAASGAWVPASREFVGWWLAGDVMLYDLTEEQARAAVPEAFEQ
jgi:hypothetical protein